MSETVFILGAGASSSAGAPLMKDFLDAAEFQRKHGRYGREDFQLVFDGISELMQAHSKSAIDLENIESVFAAFEMAKLLGRLGKMELSKVEKLTTAMQSVIEKTISANVEFPISKGGIIAPNPYPRLVRLVAEATSNHTPSAAPNFRPRRVEDFSIITFNYDICLDFAFQSIPVQYCVNWSEYDSGLLILKLHGSLNWGTCSGCNKLVPIPIADLFRNRFLDLAGRQSITIPVDFAQEAFQHCPPKLITGPLVVPPTWNKGQYHADLAPVWRAAAAQLANAENIIVCGYSLPETDKFFEYLYALGSIGTARLKRFWVFNPDEGRKRNFQGLLGQGASSRFKFFPMGFEQMFDHVRPIFNLTSN